MSAIDYGALLRVNGKFINKNDDLFSYCSDTGYVCDKATYYSDYEKKEIEIDIMGNYYVYAGDENFLLCFYKGYFYDTVFFVVNSKSEFSVPVRRGTSYKC